jgi:phosphate transport system permease protein
VQNFLPIAMASLVVIMLFAWFNGRTKAVASAGAHPSSLHSLPGYSGTYLAIWSVLPAFILLALFGLFGDLLLNLQMRQNLPADILALPVEQVELFMRNARALAFGGTASETSPALLDTAKAYANLSRTSNFVVIGAVILLTIGGFWFARGRLGKNFRARNHVEAVIFGVLMVCSGIAILTTLGIVLSLLTESLRFFSEINALDFLFGLKWSPQTAMRADQVGQSGSFGAVPLFAGTFLITFIAMVVAAPVGLYSAIYLSEYAKPATRRTVKPILEILAGVPTVVYGFFALLTIGPFIRQAAEAVGLSAQTQSALSAGLVMGIMIIPFVSSLSDDVINAVPQALRDGSYAMGATQAETVRNVVFPAALPGIMGALLLAISRAIGETMIVVMAAGQSANLTANPLEPVTTVTVQIVTLLTGDQEFDSAKTLSAFALGLVLFIITLGLNIISLRVVRKYRERYD